MNAALEEPLEPHYAELKEASRLTDAGELDDAWKIVDRYLVSDPNNALALLIASSILEKGKKVPVAYQLAKRVTELRPDRAEGWINLGRCADELWRTDEALEHFQRAKTLVRNRAQELTVLTNTAAVHLQNGDYALAEPLCRQSLILDPTDHRMRHNLGMCLLARGKWSEAWRYYSASVGHCGRKQIKYGDEPVWNGRHKQRIAIYGEQGLGDEIVFASMYREVIRDCAHVVLDCDARLEGLFRRSFPNASTYGTRTQDVLTWKSEDQKLDASIASGELGRYYRLRDTDFPADPYLVPCPDRTAMWKALFAAKGKPCIGIAWSGGTWRNGSLYRTLKMPELAPLLEAIDAHWVSLQYRDASAEIEGTPITQYPYATLTKDYDDTAALVAALDLVITVPTAVCHLSAALGTPTIAMQSSKPCWKFASGLKWHPKVKLIPNTGWADTIQKTIAEARACLGFS